MYSITLVELNEKYPAILSTDAKKKKKAVWKKPNLKENIKLGI